MRGQGPAIAGIAAVLAACGGSHTAATTVTSTLEPVTKTVTVTATPPPPQGPKTTIETNGTFIVGSDIAPGTYRSSGKYGCYWARLKSLDTATSSITTSATVRRSSRFCRVIRPS